MQSKAQKGYYAQQKAAELKKKRMRQVLWFSTVGALLVLIVVVLTIQPKPKAVTFDYSNLPVLGNPDAAVKIIEFGDYKCPACKGFNEVVKPQLVQEYVNQGKVAFHFMNLPFIGPDSNTAALAAQSVFHQNPEAYWTYLDAIYAAQGDEDTQWATPEFLIELAKQHNLPVDYALLEKDIKEGTYQDEVDEHSAKANKLNVDSTPTLFVNGVQFTGDFRDYSELRKAVESELQGE